MTKGTDDKTVETTGGQNSPDDEKSGSNSRTKKGSQVKVMPGEKNVGQQNKTKAGHNSKKPQLKTNKRAKSLKRTPGRHGMSLRNQAGKSQ